MASLESKSEKAHVWSQGKRTTISFLLFLHLFAIFVAVYSNKTGSPLAIRLRRTPFVRPYVQLLAQDTSLGYNLTAGDASDVDHAIVAELQLASGETRTVVLPPDHIQPPLRFWRYERLARVSTFLTEESDAGVMLLKGVAQHLVDKNGAVSGVLRCRQHRLLSMEFAGSSNPADRDPYRENLYVAPYSANILVGSSGSVELAKIESASDAAPAVMQP